jgi:hypothetical protein
VYSCHAVCIFLDLVVVFFGSFRCSWDIGSVRVALSGDSASSTLLFGRCRSPLCSLACITFEFSMYMLVCPSSVVCFSSFSVQSDTPSSHKGTGVLVACPST